MENLNLKKNGTTLALGSVPVGILALMYTTLTDLNKNLAVIASQVARNTNDIVLQKKRSDLESERNQAMREDIARIRAILERTQ